MFYRKLKGRGSGEVRKLRWWATFGQFEPLGGKLGGGKLGGGELGGGELGRADEAETGRQEAGQC